MKIKDILKVNKNNTEGLENVSAGEQQKEGMSEYSKAYNLEDIHNQRIRYMEKNNINFKEGSPITKKTMASDLGALTFKTSIFKQELKTPHMEMQKSMEAYEEVPHIAAGINQIVLFITGNGLKITSEDEYTEQWYEKWLKQRNHMFTSVQNIVLLLEIAGNAYIEPIWDTIGDNDENKEVYMNDFKVVLDPTRVYYNLNEPINTNRLPNFGDDDEEREDYWIYQVPYVYRNYEEGTQVKTYRISYIKNSQAWQEVVYGIPRKKNDFIHFKTGWNRHGYYGRSYLASTINDTEILGQLLKNYAIASRYMAMGKKVFSIVPEDGEVLPLTELQNVRDALNTPEDEEHIVINRKLAVSELAPTQFNEMSNPLNYIRKDISSGVTPNFMTAWADTVTFASANKAAIPFELSLENKRASYITMLNRNILENVRKQNPKLKDATFEFGEVTLDDVNEMTRTYSDLYDKELITLNQFLKKANLPVVENGDVYKTKRNYIMQKKYELEQADIERFNEPYLKRTVQRDQQMFDGDDERNIEAFKENVNKKESVVSALKFIEQDKDFLKEYKKRYNEDCEIIKTQTIKDSNIVRLCKDNNDNYFVVNNLTKGNKIYSDKAVSTRAFENVIEEIKLEYDNFIKGDDTVDRLSDELFKYAKDIQWQATKELLEELKNSSVKKEKFSGKKIFKEKNVLSNLVLGKVDGLYDMFNQKLRDKINDTINNIAKQKGVEVEFVDDDYEDSENVIETKNILSDLVFDQFKTFNQNQAQDIKRILTDGIIAERPIRDIENELKDEVVDWKKYKPSENDYKIQRIANTELHRADLQLKLLKWKDMGIEHIKYLATEDDKTRPTHRALHNRIFTIDEALALPEWKDVNCRCVMIPFNI